MSLTDPNYLRKKEREVLEGFPMCQCSNCQPEKSSWLMENLQEMDVHNFDSMVLFSELNPPVVNPVGPTLRKLAETEKLGGFPKNMDPTLVAFANHLSEQFNNFFKIHMGNDPEYNAEELFGIESAKCIAHGMKDSTTREHIRKMIGGESMNGQVNMLFECVKTFWSGDTYQEYIRKARKAHDDLIRRMDAINEKIANKKTQKLKEQED
jgi:hypothetical protein